MSRKGLFFCCLFITTVLVGCKIEIQVPEGGSVSNETGPYDCDELDTCTIWVYDLFFDQTFVAEPRPGYEFLGWKKMYRGLCGGSDEACRLATAGLEGDDQLMAVLESDEVFYLSPEFAAIDGTLRQFELGDTMQFIVNVESGRSEFSGGLPSRSNALLQVELVSDQGRQGDYTLFDLEILLAERITQDAYRVFAVRNPVIAQSPWGGVLSSTDRDQKWYSQDAVTGHAWQGGIPLVPMPLSEPQSASIEYSAYDWRPGFDSILSESPLDATDIAYSGTRQVSLGTPRDVETNLGLFFAYPVTIEHIERPGTYDISITTEMTLWLVPEIGLIEFQWRQHEYNGVLDRVFWTESIEGELTWVSYDVGQDRPLNLTGKTQRPINNSNERFLSSK